MKKYLVLAFVVIAAVIGYLCYEIHRLDTDIGRVAIEKIGEKGTIDLLGEPNEILKDNKSIPECGEMPKLYKYSFSKTALILKFEDSLVIGFDSTGAQCFFNRTSI